MDECKEKIIASLTRINASQEIFTAETITIALILRTKRAELINSGGASAFNAYIRESGIDKLIHRDDRWALINIGRYYPDVALKVLGWNKWRSWKLIWEEGVRPFVDKPFSNRQKQGITPQPLPSPPTQFLIPTSNILDHIDKEFKAMQKHYNEITIALRRYGPNILELGRRELYDGLKDHDRDVRRDLMFVKEITPSADDPMPACHVTSAEYRKYREDLEQKEGNNVV